MRGFKCELFCLVGLMFWVSKLWICLDFGVLSGFGVLGGFVGFLVWIPYGFGFAWDLLSA